MCMRRMEETHSVQARVKSCKTVSVMWSSPEVRSGPATIWQLRKGSRGVELRPLTAESEKPNHFSQGEK